MRSIVRVLPTVFGNWHAPSLEKQEEKRGRKLSTRLLQADQQQNTFQPTKKNQYQRKYMLRHQTDLCNEPKYIYLLPKSTAAHCLAFLYP